MNSPNIQVPYADCLPTPELHAMLNHAIWLKQPLRSKKKKRQWETAPVKLSIKQEGKRLMENGIGFFCGL